jgi:hypothetical protein
LLGSYHNINHLRILRIIGSPELRCNLFSKEYTEQI